MSALTRPDRPSTRLETLIGRSAAMCVHPVAAWRARSTKRRLVVLLAYAAAGYAAVLGALLIR